MINKSRIPKSKQYNMIESSCVKKLEEVIEREREVSVLACGLIQFVINNVVVQLNNAFNIFLCKLILYCNLKTNPSLLTDV